MDRIPELARRASDSHKGDYGRALLVGGSRGMAGAIALTGMSTLRSGAGLVTVAVPDVCLETVAACDPCYMTVPLPCDGQGRLAADAEKPLRDLAGKATACACGPGLGRSDDLDHLVQGLYAELEGPLVVDADALNALAHDAHGLRSPGGPRVLTPHPGEFDRLSGMALSNTEDAHRIGDRAGCSPWRRDRAERASDVGHRRKPLAAQRDGESGDGNRGGRRRVDGHHYRPVMSGTGPVECRSSGGARSRTGR